MAYNPFEEMLRMHDEVDRLFSRAFGTSRPLIGNEGENRGKSLEDYRVPHADLKETKKSYIASFEIPGADKNDIELNVSGDQIEVKVEKKTEKEVKGKDNYSYTKTSRQFYRCLPLPSEVVSDKAEAEYKHGILKIEVPKAKQIENKKKIAIK